MYVRKLHNSRKFRQKLTFKKYKLGGLPFPLEQIGRKIEVRETFGNLVISKLVVF